jgi:hypothetical protein
MVDLPISWYPCLNTFKRSCRCTLQTSWHDTLLSNWSCCQQHVLWSDTVVSVIRTGVAVVSDGGSCPDPGKQPPRTRIVIRSPSSNHFNVDSLARVVGTTLRSNRDISCGIRSDCQEPIAISSNRHLFLQHVCSSTRPHSPREGPPPLPVHIPHSRFLAHYNSYLTARDDP